MDRTTGTNKQSWSDYLNEAVWYLRLRITRPRWPFFLHRSGSAAEARQRDFLRAVFILMAHVERVDGRMSEEEQHWLESALTDELRLETKLYIIALQAFREIRLAPPPIEEAAETLRELTRGRADVVASIVMLLLGQAFADRRFTVGEEKSIKRMAGLLGLGDSAYESIKNRYRTREELKLRLEAVLERRAARQRRRAEAAGGARKRSGRSEGFRYGRAEASVSKPDDEYGILGLRPGCTVEQIKSAHRKVVLQCHPDRLSAQGLSPEAQEQGRKKFMRAQAAYEKLRSERQF